MYQNWRSSKEAMFQVYYPLYTYFVSLWYTIAALYWTKLTFLRNNFKPNIFSNHVLIISINSFDNKSLTSKKLNAKDWMQKTDTRVVILSLKFWAGKIFYEFFQLSNYYSRRHSRHSPMNANNRQSGKFRSLLIVRLIVI